MFKKRYKCPNYGQTSWKNEKGQVKTTHDCAPQRTMIMMAEVLNRVVALQAANEQQRNVSGDLTNIMGQVITTIQHNPNARLKIQ